MLYQSLRNVGLAVETIREEYVNLINQKNLGVASFFFFFFFLFLIFRVRIFPFENFLFKNFTNVPLFIYLKLCDFVESSIFNFILETKFTEEGCKGFVISLTQILAVAGTFDFESVKSQYNANNC